MRAEDEQVPAMMVEAWNRRDVEAFASFLDPEVEYVNAPTAVEPGTRHGSEAALDVARKQWEGLPGAEQAIDRIHVRGDEVVTVGRISRPMPGSDSRLEVPTLLSWTIRDGKVTRLQVLGAGSGFAEALAEAGLED